MRDFPQDILPKGLDKLTLIWSDVMKIEACHAEIKILLHPLGMPLQVGGSPDMAFHIFGGMNSAAASNWYGMRKAASTGLLKMVVRHCS